MSRWTSNCINRMNDHIVVAAGVNQVKMSAKDLLPIVMRIVSEGIKLQSILHMQSIHSPFYGIYGYTAYTQLFSYIVYNWIQSMLLAGALARMLLYNNKFIHECFAICISKYRLHGPDREHDHDLMMTRYCAIHQTGSQKYKSE